MILLIDDKPENLLSLGAVLREKKFVVDTALSGEEGLKKALKKDYRLIILDVQMPGMDGFEVAEALNGYSKTRDVPVNFLTANYKDKRFVTKGYDTGGADYITKPVDADILLFRIKSLYRLQEQMKEISATKEKLEYEVEERKLAEKKKDELLSVASHELKTPLTSITGYHELIRRTLENDQATAKIYLDRSAGQLKRLSSLLNRMLDYSAIENQQLNMIKSHFSFTGLLTNVIQMMGDLFPDHEILRSEGYDIQIYADPLRIEQVLLNYIGNAIKYSPYHKEIRVSAALKSSQLIFTVKDYGIGISEEKRACVFDKFYRAQDSYHQFPGIGIGLYISRQIIERHQGKCWVKSEEGRL